MIKRKNRSVEIRNSRNGFLFVLPWTVGFLLFFMVPLFQSVIFSFSDVSTTTEGLKIEYEGLANFRYIFY